MTQNSKTIYFWIQFYLLSPTLFLEVSNSLLHIQFTIVDVFTVLVGRTLGFVQPLMLVNFCPEGGRRERWEEER